MARNSFFTGADDMVGKMQVGATLPQQRSQLFLPSDIGKPCQILSIQRQKIESKQVKRPLAFALQDLLQCGKIGISIRSQGDDLPVDQADGSPRLPTSWASDAKRSVQSRPVRVKTFTRLPATLSRLR